MEKMEAKKTPPSSPLALLPDTPRSGPSAPQTQMSSREMVREKVNRIKEKAAAQKAERARKKEEEEVVVSCYVGMPSVPDDNESEDSAGDEDEEDEESGQKLSAKGNEHKRKDEEEEAELDGRYAADDAVADIYSSTVDTPASSYGPSPYESFNRGAGEGQSVYYADAVDEELARDEHEVNSIYAGEEEAIQSGEQTIYSEATGQPASESAEASHSREEEEEEEEESESESDPEEDKLDDTSPLSRRAQKAKNWNEEFQKLLDREPSAAKFNDLAKLAHDFVFAAETYGKIIISELSLPEPKKTIKPMAVGGQAGGEKYIVQGIFFKFALDLYGIYGGDEFAMKAASHDLKGLTHYYSCQIPGLHVPLMALIDYLGFRLIAITILPINSHTIQYGSGNAGVTVHADDPALNRMMKKAGRKMHLQGHYVGLPGAVSKKLFAPVDIEGHLGTDGRYYVVDFARTFPPERPSPQNRSRRGIVLYNLLRPELVKSNVTPLSSDAFTIWAKADLHKDQYNTDVTEATKRLIKQVIPAVAEKMNNLVKNQSRAEEDLIEIIHSAGVNIRHLGYLRRRVNEKHQRDILIEMIARVVRKEVEKLLREKTRSSGIPSEEPHRVAVVGYLNKLLGRDSKSKAFWRHMKRTLQDKFARCLLDVEMAGNYDLRRGIDLHQFVKRLQSVPCIAFTEQARQDLNKAIDEISGNWADSPPDFKFLPCDLLPFPASVKHMNLIDIAEANAMFYTSLDEKGTDQARLLKLGLIKYQMAARKMPFIDADILVTLGNLLISHARDKHNAGNKQELLGQAMIAYQTALNIHPNHASCKVGLGDALFADAKFDEAKTQYREALVLEPNHARAHLQLGRTYQELLTNSRTTEEVIQDGWVETEYRKALECDPKQIESMILLGELQFDRVYSATDVGPEELELLLVETARLWERALMFDAQTTLSIFVDTVNAVNKVGWYAKYTAQRMGCIWLIAERSELLKQYLCKLLETVKAWTVLETEPQGREESLMCVILCHCPALTDVTLRNNPRFTGESACKWLKDHKTPLHALDLSGCDQLSDALLDLLPTSVHAKSLQSLCLDGAVLLSKAALVACFTPAEDEPDRWQALGQLHLAGIPAVDPEVIETVCRSCVALRDFSFLETSADDSALAHIPTDMRKVSIGGSVGIPALTTFVGSCQGLTRLSLKGLGVPYNEIFHLANALPSLEEFQTTTGSTFLFTGNSPAVIRFSPQANLFQREHTDGKREILYHVHHGAAAFLRGETSTFHLRNANLHKSIADTVHTLTQATFNPHSQPGNLIRPLVPGVTHLTALFYNSSMRKVESRPPHIISINGGYMNITAFTEHVFNVAPRQNLTVVLALYFQLVLAK